MHDSTAKDPNGFHTCPISGVLCRCLKDCTKDDVRVKMRVCLACGNHHGSAGEEDVCKDKEILRLRKVVFSLESEIRPLREMKTARDKNIEDYKNIPRTPGGIFEERGNPKKRQLT